MAKSMSKAGLIQAIVDELSDTLTRKDVKGVLRVLLRPLDTSNSENPGNSWCRALQNSESSKSPPRKNTKASILSLKEPMTFKAKLARNILRARPVKASRDAIA